MNKNRYTEYLKQLMAVMKESIMNAVYPPRCPLCQCILETEETRICSRCRPKLPYIREPLCKKCGKPLHKEEQEYCLQCEMGKHLFICGRSVFRYEKAFRKSVQRMKFHNHREYLDFYAEEMAETGAFWLERWNIQTVIPVPLHIRKRRQRGFDQTGIMAEKFCSMTGAHLDHCSVKRIRHTRPQKDLKREERRTNLKGAFAVQEGAMIREPVLLIDDIYTTGATMDELCRVLRENGITEVYFLSLCAGNGK